MVTMPKKWYYSKTKIGGLLVGGGMVLQGLGNVILGNGDPSSNGYMVITGLGIISGAFGIRDAIEKK